MMRTLSRLIALLLFAALAFVAWMAYFAQAPLAFKTAPLDFTVKPGSSLRQTARELVEAGIDMPAWQFTLLSRILGRASAIKAGSYEFEPGLSPWLLLEKLTRGDVSQAELSFPEGWSFRQMRAALDAHPAITHDTAGLSEYQILEKLGVNIGESGAEGQFFPDTYLFAKASSDLAILKRAHHQMRQSLEKEWGGRAEGLPYATPYEALIMASIVEKETGKAEDRRMIAAVFINRLKRGMLLQTDPTVIYGMGEKFDGNLRKRDLQTDSPYNTYLRPGLPPTPIAMPGLASLQAALHPAENDHLYFVARGDGSSQFSRTLDEHNRAVNKYQKRNNH